MALKILLADDSMTAQNMGKKILNDAGYDVVAVSNGAAAIKKMASERPDLAILDVYMPGYTGLEVCERVKGALETARIPVLLTVGKMEAFNPEDVNKVRADGLMIKPFEATDLIAAVQSISKRLAAATGPVRTSERSAPARSSVLEDTLPIEPPATSDPADHQSTIRLTADQIRAFQEGTQKDWMVAAPEMPVAAAAAVEPEFESAAPAIPVIPDLSEMPAFAALEELDEAPKSNVISDVAMTAIEPSPAETSAADQAIAEHPVVTDTETTDSSWPVSEPQALTDSSESFAVEPEVAVGIPSPAEQLPAFVPSLAAPSETILSTDTASGEPASATFVSEVVPPEQPAIVEAVAEVPVQIAPADGLEITSPPAQLGGEPVAPEPALVTESEDMSQFVTTFGSAGAENIHVGLATDLAPEQFAAITAPPEEPTPSIASPDASSTLLSGPAEAPVLAPVQLPESVVAYVPGLDDTQPLQPVRDEEPRAEVVATAPLEDPVPQAIEAIPVIDSSEPVVDAAETVTSSSGGQISESSTVSEPTPGEQSSQFAAASEPVAEPEPIVSPIAVSDLNETELEKSSAPPMQAIEAAAAAAAGVVMAGFSHVFQEHATSTVSPSVDEAAGISVPSSSSDQAASISTGSVAPGPAASDQEATLEQHAELEALATPINANMDNRIAEAVARAFENLKPRLITEILKELGK